MFSFHCLIYSVAPPPARARAPYAPTKSWLPKAGGVAPVTSNSPGCCRAPRPSPALAPGGSALALQEAEAAPEAAPGWWCPAGRNSSDGTSVPRCPDVVHPHLWHDHPSGVAAEMRTGKTTRRTKRELSLGSVRQEASLRLLQQLQRAPFPRGANAHGSGGAAWNPARLCRDRRAREPLSRSSTGWAGRRRRRGPTLASVS